MGRRSTMSMKMVLPTVSWLAVMRLLKKAPSGIMGIDAASKALLGCSALPDTPSLRYTDNYLAQMSDSSGVRRPKPASGAALLPLIGCASRPHTDSFRIHHVVNQEALQLVLDQTTDYSDDIFYEPFGWELESLNCSFDMIIRDGDRLLHDIDVCNEAASASVMSTCSSRLSNCTAGSSGALSAARTAFSRSSIDSDQEGHYSTASSASFQVTPGHPAQCSTSCCSSPMYCHSANLSAGRIDYNADTYSMSESANSCEDQSFGIGQDDQLLDEAHSFAQDCSTAAQNHANTACAHDVDACHAHHFNGNDHDHGNDMDVDDGMVAETCYSEDPLVDFEESIEELVLCHRLIGQAEELHALYCRYIQLNPTTLHPTIALAFFRTLQRLSSSSRDKPISL